MSDNVHQGIYWPAGVTVSEFANDEAAWLVDRKHGIGSSDAPYLYDAVPGGREKLRLVKLGLLEDTPSADILTLGKRVERVTVEYAQDVLGVGHVWRPWGLAFHRTDAPWLRATPDAVEIDGALCVAPIELKFVKYLREYDPAANAWPTLRWDKGERPLRFMVQLQHQMAVLGSDHGWLVVFIGAEGRVVVERVARDERFQRRHEAACAAFWREVEVARSLEPVTAEGGVK